MNLPARWTRYYFPTGRGISNVLSLSVSLDNENTCTKTHLNELEKRAKTIPREKCPIE